jgi:hypothetical protein
MLFLLKKYYLLFYILSITLLLICLTIFDAKYRFYFGNNYLVHFCDAINCFLTTLCISYKYKCTKENNYFEIWPKIYIYLYNTIISKITAGINLFFYLFIYFFISLRWISLAYIFEINLYKVSTTFFICLLKYIATIYIVIRLYTCLQVPVLIVLKKYFWEYDSISKKD